MSVNAGAPGLQARLGIDTSGLGQQLAQGAVAGARTAGSAIGNALMNALNGSLGSIGNAGTKMGHQLAGNVVEGATAGGGGGIGGQIAKAVKSDTAKATAAGTAFGHVMGEAIGAAASKAADIGMNAIGATLERGNTKAKLQAQLDLSPQEAARMGKIAGDVYAGNYGESLSQVNDAMKQAMQGGIIDKDATDAEIKSVTANMLSVGAAFDKDTEEVAKAVGSMMKNGLVSSAQEGLDVYTRGLQTGADKAGDLADTFEEYGTQFRQLGITGAQATALINQGLAGGARNGDLVADSLKEFPLIVAGGGKKVEDAYKSIGLNGKKMQADIAAGGDRARVAFTKTMTALKGTSDPLTRNTAAVALFGTKAEDMQKALFSLDPAAAKLDKVANSSQKVNDTMSDTPAAQIEGFKRTLEGAFVDTIGTKVIPILGDMAESIGLSKDSIGPLMDIAVPLGGVLLGLAGAIKLVSLAQAGWSAVTKAFTAVQAAFNFVMAMSPLGWIVLGIVALVAVLTIAYLKSETFRQWVSKAFDAVGKALGAMWDWFKRVGPQIGQWFLDVIKKGIAFIGWWVTLPIRVGKAIWDFIVRVGTLWVRFQIEFAKFVGSIIKKGLDFIGWWVTLPIRIGKAIGGLAGRMYKAATDTVAGFAKGIRDGAHTIIETIKTFITDAIPNFIKSTFDINSPSRVMAKLFGYLPQGAAVGIQKMSGLAVRAASVLSSDVHDAMVVAPPTIGATEFRSSQARAAAVSDVVALSGAGGGSKTVQFTGPAQIVTGTPADFIDEQTESAAFSSLAPVRG